MQRRLLSLTAALSSILFMVGCAWTTIEPGHVGIEVNLSGADRGVSSYTPTTGRVFYNSFNTTIFQYPTFVQNAVWTASTNEGAPADESITFTTKDSMRVNADFNVSYELAADKVPAFYVKFRNDDIQKFTDGYLHNIARDCINRVAGAYNVEQIMGDNAPFLDGARACTQSDVVNIGVKLDSFGLIGAPRPPEIVIQAINSKVQAQQIALQKQNEILQAEADAKKRIAQAEGEATANKRLTESLTPNLLEWRRLGITESAVQRWDGHRPTVEGNSSGLLLNINPQGR